jgi:hypothetical protein
MEYLLSEDEYNDLRTKNEKEIEDKQNIINKLCTRICDLEPKCIHTAKTEWYCDECPVDEFCTQFKNYSK